MQLASVDHTRTTRWAALIFQYLHDPIERLVATVLISLAEPHGTVRVSLQRLAYLCETTATFNAVVSSHRAKVVLERLHTAGLLVYGPVVIELADPKSFGSPEPVAVPHQPSPVERQIAAATMARARGCRKHAFDSGWWIKAGNSIRWSCSACRMH